MDSNNWRPAQGGGEPIMDTADWRLQLAPESRERITNKILLWKNNWFIQEKSCKILTMILSTRPKSQMGTTINGEASTAKGQLATIDTMLKGLVDWLCGQLKNPSHPSSGIPIAINSLTTLLKEPVVRSSFVLANGVKLLVPLISQASSQQSIQLLYETCLCVWLLSYYEPAIEYLATSRTLQRLIEVVKGSTKEKVVRVIVLTLRNLLSNWTFGALMVDLELPQIVQSIKAQAWSDENLYHIGDAVGKQVAWPLNKLKTSSPVAVKQEKIAAKLDMLDDPTSLFCPMLEEAFALLLAMLYDR